MQRIRNGASMFEKITLYNVARNGMCSDARATTRVHATSRIYIESGKNGETQRSRAKSANSRLKT